jgi:hypothetical protein
MPAEGFSLKRTQSDDLQQLIVVQLKLLLLKMNIQYAIAVGILAWYATGQDMGQAQTVITNIKNTESI